MGGSGTERKPDGGKVGNHSLLTCWMAVNTEPSSKQHQMSLIWYLWTIFPLVAWWLLLPFLRIILLCLPLLPHLRHQLNWAIWNHSLTHWDESWAHNNSIVLQCAMYSLNVHHFALNLTQAEPITGKTWMAQREDFKDNDKKQGNFLTSPKPEFIPFYSKQPCFGLHPEESTIAPVSIFRLKHLKDSFHLVCKPLKPAVPFSKIHIELLCISLIVKNMALLHVFKFVT